MKRTLIIKIYSTFLLMLYFISITPSLLIHQHSGKIVPLEDATVCEAAIYYGELNLDLQHKGHISLPLEKCWLCDHHTVTPQILAEPLSLQHFKPKLNQTADYSFDSYVSVFFFHSFQRGPPTV